jgi:formylglycine-generating enzyme required for sulfatase activity
MSREHIKHGRHLMLLRNSRPVRTLLAGATLAAVMTLLPITAAAQLSPAIQADLYLVQTEEYLKEKDYAAAREAMENLIKLAEEHDLTVPGEFHFKHAQVLNLAEEYAEASAALHRYLESAGREGAHYWEALTLLHEVSEAGEAQAKVSGMAKNMKMVVVPAGSYQMGSPSSEADRYDDEGPVHQVTIPRPFAVGAYEVTFAEWDACVDSGGCGGYRPDDAGWGRGRRPVINVSWEDAQRFVAWLRQGTGHEYRLLSEAEWEYVARAGTTTPFHTGSTIATSQANYDGNYTYGNGRTGEYREKTVLVGSFNANTYGLYDVHGNVWEWVEDCWNVSYRGSPSDGSAWERGDCGRRVLRGGSWYDYPRSLRSANPIRYDPGNRSYYDGFRVARTLDS